MNANKMHREKVRSEQNTSCTTTNIPSHKPSKTNICWILLAKEGRSHKRCSSMDQQELTLALC